MKFRNEYFGIGENSRYEKLIHLDLKYYIPTISVLIFKTYFK